MILESRQIIRSNRFFTYLNQQTEEYLNENNIVPCGDCEKTGLSDLTRLDYGGYSWSGVSYCKECKGIGFKGIFEKGMQLSLLDYVCRECDGSGCDSCNNKGVVDWVDHLMGR